jgi:hypothetical protein
VVQVTDNASAISTMFCGPPSTYDFLTQEGFTVSRPFVIYLKRITADKKVSVNPDKQVFVVPCKFLRVTPGGGSVPVSFTVGNAYIVSDELVNAEYFVFNDTFIQNTGYTPPEEDK